MYLTEIGFWILGICLLAVILKLVLKRVSPIPELPEEIRCQPTWGVTKDWELKWDGLRWEWVRFSNAPGSWDHHVEWWSPAKGYKRMNDCRDLEGFGG